MFSWWTRDPKDGRSAVTLRHLLSFTSGFYWKDASGVVPCLEGLGSITYSPEKCAQQIYEQAPFEFAAGSTFSYNSFHLQVAGAMAAVGAGIGRFQHPIELEHVGQRLCSGRVRLIRLVGKALPARTVNLIKSISCFVSAHVFPACRMLYVVASSRVPLEAVQEDQVIKL